MTAPPHNASPRPASSPPTKTPELTARAVILIPSMALLLLSAHALRQGDPGQTAAWALLAGLLLTGTPWPRAAALLALGWGAFVWGETAWMLVRMRQALDLPWIRLALIMAGVMTFNAAGMVVLARKALDAGARCWTQAGAWFVCVTVLGVAREAASFPILLADRLPADFGPWGWLQIMVMGSYAAWLAGLAHAPRGHRRVRPRAWFAFSLVFFGQFVLGLTVSPLFLMTGDLHLPVPALIVGGPLFRGDFSFMLALFCGAVALVGPAWCSHLCYIGAWDDAMARRSGAPRGDAGRALWAGRGATLALTVTASLGLRWLGAPWPMALAAAAVFGLVGVGVMVAVSRRRGRMVHCLTWCPIGLLSVTLGRLSPWRMRTGAGCAQCGACATACRYNALTPADIQRGRPGFSCTLCGECAGACPRSSMGYRAPGLSPVAARGVFLAVTLGLHAAFMGVARP